VNSKQLVELVTTVTRDVGSVALGLWGIYHQQITGVTSWELLVVYGALLGVPGVAGVLQLLRNGGAGTASLPSASPASSSPATSSPSSAGEP
jgi:hypothetical protein